MTVVPIRRSKAKDEPMNVGGAEIRMACRHGTYARNDLTAIATQRSQMREGGLEPPRPFGHQILNLARLPIPPLSPVLLCKRFTHIYESAAFCG